MTTTAGAAPDSLETLWDIAQGSRKIHELALTASDLTETQGSCLYASIALASAINKFSAWHAEVAGGWWRAADGLLHGHYWVRAWILEASYVVDITADQFGQATVLVLPTPAAESYIADDPTTVQEHVRMSGLPPVLPKPDCAA